MVVVDWIRYFDDFGKKLNSYADFVSEEVPVLMREKE